MTKLNKDIKLPYHRHKYEIASVRIRFNESGDYFDDLWPICSSCLKYQTGLNSKRLQKIWDENEFNIGCTKEKEHVLVTKPLIYIGDVANSLKTIRSGGLT